MSNSYPPSGVLFGNDRKQRDTHPDYTGNLEFSREVVEDLFAQLREGVEKPVIDLAGWRKTTKGGKPFLSLRGAVPYRRRQGERNSAPQQSQRQPERRASDFDDEIAF